MKSQPMCSKKSSAAGTSRRTGEEGLALLISMIALSVLSLLGLYMSLNATTEVRISDNYESQVQASLAAQAGLNHAREAMRGVPVSVHLNGPDGTHSTSSAYLGQAANDSFRNPISWNLARSLRIANPGTDLATVPDDGVLTTGLVGGVTGTSLIPQSGIAWTVANPNGSGNVVIARYFVKVTNNTSEDPSGNPFVDGDNIVIVRSMGISRTIREDSGGIVRRNSVAVYEAKFRQRATFNLDAPLVVEGNEVSPSGPQMWDGNAFRIDGGASNYGIATIDTNTTDGTLPTTQISSQLAINQRNRITGMGSSPSIADVTNLVSNDPDKMLLRDPVYLWNLVHNVLPLYANNIFYTDQHWAGGLLLDLGSVDMSKPMYDPSQHPMITVVEGNLDIGGNMSGGGMLVVTGNLGGNGHLSFNGLILVIGAGNVDGSGLNVGINGGMFIANMTMVGGTPTFGTPRFTWRGNSNIVMNSASIHLAMQLLPLEQLSWREVTGATDRN